MEKDEEYKRDQFIGEELDWKMLADNLTLFGSQLGDLKDMQGFDPSDGDNLLMDQSIVVGGDGPDLGGAPALGEISAGAGYTPPQNLLGDIDAEEDKDGFNSTRERSGTLALDAAADLMGGGSGADGE